MLGPARLAAQPFPLLGHAKRAALSHAQLANYVIALQVEFLSEYDVQSLCFDV